MGFLAVRAERVLNPCHAAMTGRCDWRAADQLSPVMPGALLCGLSACWLPLLQCSTEILVQLTGKADLA